MSLGISRFKKLLGMERVSRPFDSEISAYERLRLRGLVPDGIIDVGAYEGAWTRAALSVWPHCPVLMVEPQAAKKEKLEAVCKQFATVEYRQKLLAAHPGREEIFYEMETGSSIYAENSNAPRRAHSLETSTLDLEAEHFSGRQLFVKIDVQGAEVDVLMGGANTLARSLAIQIEVPFITYNSGAPSFHDVITLMASRNFSPIEISNHTILNGVSVQADFVYVHESSPFLRERLNF